MTDYADIILKLNSFIKHYHEAVLKEQYTQAYLVACSITEIAQELEDWTSKKRVH
jgi:hypothetical protein